MSGDRGAWERLLAWLLDGHRASRGLAVMRIGFGTVTIAYVLMLLPQMSYAFGEASRWGEAVSRASPVNGYLWPVSEIFSRGDSDPVTLVKVILLLLVALAYAVGWHMRVTSPVLVAMLLGFATANPQVLSEGHHETLRVMLIFLLLADTSRVWSLDARARGRGRALPSPGVGAIRIAPWFPTLANNVAVILIGAQLCIAYVSSALWKLQGADWAEGRAVYYALRVDETALFPALNDALSHATPLVLIASLAAVYLPLTFPVLLLNRWTRAIALAALAAMHVAIGVLLAQPWMSLVMIVSLAIFVREETWAALAAWTRPRALRLWNRMTWRRAVRRQQARPGRG